MTFTRPPRRKARNDDNDTAPHFRVPGPMGTGSAVLPDPATVRALPRCQRSPRRGVGIDPAAAVRQRPHRRPFTRRDVESLASLAVASCALALLIDGLVPGPQWWTHELTSGWEISFGFAMVAVAVAGPLLSMMAALLTAMIGLALVSWLSEPVDDEPESPTRMQTARRASAQAWNNTFRRGRLAREAGRA